VKPPLLIGLGLLAVGLLRAKQSGDTDEPNIADLDPIPGSGEVQKFPFTRLAIDYDGSPRAYHPNKRGLDNLRNAGKPPYEGAPYNEWKWWGIAVDRDNNPIVQGPNDPNPGYFVSITAQAKDPSRASGDPLRYYDAENDPYAVVPREFAYLKGSYVDVVIPGIGRQTLIVADIGPTGKWGEISLAAARRFGSETTINKEGWYEIFA